MSGSTKGENPKSSANSPMQASGPKGSHKRRLSNDTPDSPPVRRSKRQRSSVNLKEASSSDELEARAAVKPTPKKATQTKAQRASSVKKEQVDDTELVSSVEAGRRESVTKSEDGDIAVKTEIEAAAVIQKKPARKGRKTKEEKEAEAMPLAVRTQGLKMFVGAHVSAAKGMPHRASR